MSGRLDKILEEGLKKSYLDGYNEANAEQLEQPTPKQEGTISITVAQPIGYLCENAVGHKYFRWKKPPSTYKPIALYAEKK